MSRAGLSAVLLATAVLGFGAASANAFECVFITECYEAEGCSGTTFNIEVDIHAEAVSTDFGDLQIVAVKETDVVTTLFATGDGAEYLLSLTPRAARFTAHNNSGPEVISYLGQCEGAY